MVSIPQQKLTATAWQLLPCSNKGKGKSKLECALTGRTDPSDSGTSNWQDSVKRHMLVLLTVSLFVLGGDSFCWDLHTSTLLCGQKTEGWWKEKVTVPTSSKILNYSAKRWKRPADTSPLFIKIICCVFYYFDLSSFKHSSPVGSANCHKRLFCSRILVFLRNSFPICCWVFQFKHIYYSP